MEKKFLSKAELYRYSQISWWNDGTERKPSKREFDNFAWYPVKKNFNVKWVSLFNITITVPAEYEYNFFWLKYTIPNSKFSRNEYYYVEKVLSRNSVNKTLLLTLDIWCTYIIGSIDNPNVPEIYELDAWTNRYLVDSVDNETAKLSSMKQIPPFGFLTRHFGYSELPIYDEKNVTKNFEKGLWNNRYPEYDPNPYFKEFTYNPTRNLNRTGVHRYYVFSYSLPTEYGRVESRNNFGTTRKQKGYSVQSGIILIPSLFESVGCYINSSYKRGDFRFEDLKFWKDQANPSSWYFRKNADWKPPSAFFLDTRYYLFNDELNLIRLAERINEHKPWSGLTRFLGVHYGENYFKLINKFNKNNGYYESYESPSTKWSTLYWTGTSASTLAEIDYDNFLEMGGYDFKNPTGRDRVDVMGFACVKIPPDGLDILDTSIFNKDKDVVKFNAINQHYLGDDDYSHNFGKKKLYFTDRFVICNEYSCKEYNSEVPLMLDDYYNVLQATKPQRDAALRSAVGSFFASGINNWASPAIHGQGVLSEKTAWGQYFRDVGSMTRKKGIFNTLSVDPNLSHRELTGLETASRTVFGSYEKNILSKNYENIGLSDIKMGKISAGLGALSSVGSLINSSVQLATTIDGLIQQQKSIRYQTGSSLTSTSSAFLKSKNYLDIVESEIDRDEGNNYAIAGQMWYKEIYCGLTTSFKKDFFDYYGVEMSYTILNKKIKDIRDNWLVFPEGENLYRDLYNKYKNVLHTEIIEAIAKMLSQGVRVLPKP